MSAGRKNNSTNKDFNTPPKYVEAVMEFFNGKLDLDPCSNEFSLIKADKSISLPRNGLEENWNKYETIFCNPPYGRYDKTSIYTWLEKARDTNLHFGSEILFLIPVATNTKHFKNLIFKYACGICFLEDTRLKFWTEGKEMKKGAPFAACFIYFGRNYDKFTKVFSKYGKCFKI